METKVWKCKLRTTFDKTLTSALLMRLDNLVEDRIFVKTVTDNVQLKEGHYQIPLPFKQHGIEMPNNRSQAEHCATQLKRRLIKNPQLQEDYKAFGEEIFQVFNVVSEISFIQKYLFIQCGDGKPRLSLYMALLLVCRHIEINPHKHLQFTIVASANYRLTGRM